MEAAQDTRKAAENARKSLDDDSRKAALAKGEDALKMADQALWEGRMQRAVIFAAKAMQGLPPDKVDARCTIAEALLEAGQTAQAKSGYLEASKQAGAKGSIRAVAGVTAALVQGGCTRAELEQASDEWVKRTIPKASRIELAKLHLLRGSYDEAVAVATECSAAAKPGEPVLGRALLLGAECQVGMYAEAAWGRARAERPDDKKKPATSTLAEWRLSRAREELSALIKKDPNSVRGHARMAELKLEELLYTRLLKPLPEEERGGSGADDFSTAADNSSQADEIRALMRMDGVAESKLGDAGEALRVLERRRKMVRELGGAGAMDEAEELGRLHEWQMRQLKGSGGNGGSNSGGGSEAGVAAASEAAEQLLGEALESCDLALRNDAARCAPALLLLRARLLVLRRQAADALVPANAAFALLAPMAAWRKTALAASSAADAAAQKSHADQAAPTAGGAPQEGLHLQAQYLVGVSAAEAGSPFDEFAPQLQVALRAVHLELSRGLDGAVTTGAAAAAATAASPAVAATTGHVRSWRGRPVGPLSAEFMSPLNPMHATACRHLAEGQRQRRLFRSAACTAELGERCAGILLQAAPDERAELAVEIALERFRLALLRARAHAERGAESEAARVLKDTVLALQARRGGGQELHAQGLLSDGRAVTLLAELATEWLSLMPQCAAAHEAQAVATVAAYDANPLLGSAAGSEGETLLKEVCRCRHMQTHLPRQTLPHRGCSNKPSSNRDVPRQPKGPSQTAPPPSQTPSCGPTFPKCVAGQGKP